MATRKRLTLDAWIHDALNDDKDNRKCSQISLVHMIGQTPKELHSVKFGAKAPAKPEDLAVMFKQRAEGYAQDLSGTQMFQLLAFYGKNEPESFMPFTVTPHVDPTNVLPSEPATPEGQRQQDMRRNEMVFQQMLRQQQVLNDHSTSVMAQQTRMIAELLSENRASFNIVKEMLMEKALDTHRHQMEALTYQRQSDERKKWLSYIPMLANTVLGKEIFPQSNADTVLLEQVVESIDENAIMALAQFVKPELMGPLMSRFEEIQKKKMLEAQNKVHALQPVKGVEPEDDTVGGKE